MYKVTVFNTVQCQREARNHQIEGVPNSRVAVRCEHRQMLSNRIKILECVHGMLAQLVVDQKRWLK